MADVQPLRALHYDQAVAGPLQDLVAPPYDVIDPPAARAAAARSPHNVVAIDLPAGRRPLRHRGRDAAGLDRRGRDRPRPGARHLGPRPGLHRRPTAASSPATGFLARVRVEDYGPGRIRPHERTHPGPKEDRLRLTRATQGEPVADLLALQRSLRRGVGRPDAAHRRRALGRGHRRGRHPPQPVPRHRPGRHGDACTTRSRDAELLIADGHHRYETARVYAEEIGGEGDHRYVLMCLVALEDEGLTVFPTHRLVRGTTPRDAGGARRRDARATSTSSRSTLEELAPARRATARSSSATSTRTSSGPMRLTLKDQAIADAALAGMPEAYRRLDTAVLEALLLKGPLGLTERRHRPPATGSATRATDAGAGSTSSPAASTTSAFFLRPTPVAQVSRGRGGGREHAAEVDVLLPQGPHRDAVQPLVEAS